MNEQGSAPTKPVLSVTHNHPESRKAVDLLRENEIDADIEPIPMSQSCGMKLPEFKDGRVRLEGLGAIENYLAVRQLIAPRLKTA